MKTITLKSTKRLTSGHLWVFSNEISHKLSDFEAGEMVEMVNAKGEYLATGYVNPHTLIAARVLSRRRAAIDREFLHERLSTAIDFRRRLYPDLGACRIVFGEADLLPGLIVDKYADVLVLQTLTAGMARLEELVIDVLVELLNPRCVVMRNDSSFREMEGLSSETRVARGELGDLPVINEGELRFEVDPLEGQKTGFFLDQRENRRAFAEVLDGGRGLDLFSYAGAWAAHAAAKGGEVTCVDVSARALARAEQNAALNGLSAKIQTVRSDCMEFLRKQQRGDIEYDFVMVDPPAFAKSKANLRNAINAYRQVNTLALGLVKRGGFLATSSCSYHVDSEAFLDVIHNAARAASRYARLVEYRSQARDHPALIGMPETRYLKCAIVQVM
jgi:23S rRNA (cytosine1962-C5)-methyltransferase